MHLYVTIEQGGWTEPVRLGPALNVQGGLNLGPSINPSEPGILYFTSHREGASQGRLDIYRLAYSLGVKTDR